MIRCYILQARGLAPKDLDAKADPYVKVKLGNHVVSGRAKHKSHTLDPDLYIRLPQTDGDLRTTFPGASVLEVSVYDYDLFTSDDLIGTTFIDLEDRWFSESQFSESNQLLLHGVEGGAVSRGGPGAGMRKRYARQKRPVEWRQLWSPESAYPQGEVSMFLEIVPVEAAFLHGLSGGLPPLKIEQPEPEDWEVRYGSPPPHSPVTVTIENTYPSFKVNYAKAKTSKRLLKILPF